MENFWTKPWFRKLPVVYKVLWLYLYHKKNKKGYANVKRGELNEVVQYSPFTYKDLVSQVGSQRIEKITPQRFKIKYGYKDCNIEDLDNKLEAIYMSYPRKIGKARGLRQIKSQLKTEDDLKDFQNAVKNYNLSIQKNKTELKFIKHFSSFVGSQTDPYWRDWLGEHVKDETTDKLDESLERAFR